MVHDSRYLLVYNSIGRYIGAVKRELILKVLRLLTFPLKRIGYSYFLATYLLFLILDLSGLLTSETYWFTILRLFFILRHIFVSLYSFSLVVLCFLVVFGYALIVKVFLSLMCDVSYSNFLKIYM
jgi:hypothetical protein